jgi:hypothetical protein
LRNLRELDITKHLKKKWNPWDWAMWQNILSIWVT